jgi:hypothetical protein
MKKYELIKESIPEGGIAHPIANLGTVTISDQLSDEIIDKMPEELQSKYFKKKASEEV